MANASTPNQGPVLGDLNSVFAAQLAGVAAESAASNSRHHHFTQFAFERDLFMSGQESNPGLFAGYNSADRTPVVKASS